MLLEFPFEAQRIGFQVHAAKANIHHIDSQTTSPINRSDEKLTGLTLGKVVRLFLLLLTPHLFRCRFLRSRRDPPPDRGGDA